MDRLFDEAGNLITERLGSKKINKSPEKTFKCQFCEFEYDSKSARAGHERWCDNNPKSKKINKSPEKIFKCQFCESEYDSKSAKAGHEQWCDDNPNTRKTKTKPESKKIALIPEKEIFYCQFCEQEWDKNRSKIQHERWCKKNPNPRQYRNKRFSFQEPEKKKPKKKQEKAKIKSKTKIPKGNNIIKELKEFDKTFGLTDEQIVKYIRDKIDHDKM